MLSRKFHYSALNEDGQLVTGTLQGKNKKEIEQLLLEQGLIKQEINSELTMSDFSWSEKNKFEKIINSLTNLLDSGLSITASLDYLILHSNKSVSAQSQDLKKN